MPEAERFDMLVLGSGEGGKYLAWHVARSGQRVAVVERKLIGGACPNTNCLPRKWLQRGYGVMRARPLVRG